MNTHRVAKGIPPRFRGCLICPFWKARKWPTSRFLASIRVIHNRWLNSCLLFLEGLIEYKTSHPQIQTKYNTIAKKTPEHAYSKPRPPPQRLRRRTEKRSLCSITATTYTCIPVLSYNRKENRFSFALHNELSARCQASVRCQVFGSLSLRQNSSSLNQNPRIRGMVQFTFLALHSEARCHTVMIELQTPG
jgi:hypothetical protein